MYTTFKAADAVKLSNDVEQTSLSKGKVIDMIRAAAKQGKFKVTVENLPKPVGADLRDHHGFNVDKDIISWEPKVEAPIVTK